MRVLLINPSGPKPPPTYFGPPYGLAMVAACARAAGHELRCADFDRVPEGELLDRTAGLIERFRPDVLGVSSQSSNRGCVYRLLEGVSRRPRPPRLVAGGPFPSLEPGLFLRPGRAGFVVMGEGEQSFPELLGSLERGGDPGRVAGLAFLRRGRLVRTAARPPVLDLDALPAPAFDLFSPAGPLKTFAGPRETAFAPEGFIRRRRLASVVSALTFLGSRGCRFSCRFCPQSGVKVHKLREHSPERFAEIVAGLRREHGVRDFVFGDNNFTSDRARARAVCAALKREAPGIRWICMTRADAVDPELLRDMRAAGCVEISYGIESGSPRIQRSIGKGLRLEKVPAAFEATRKAGIASVLMLMVGNPGESAETLRETLRFVRGLDPDRVLVKTTRVYPGTALHDLAEAGGVITKDFYESGAPEAPPFTAELSLSGLRELKRMLPERRVHLSLPRAASPAAARKALFAASRRCEDILLDARSLGAPALAALLRAAGKLGVHRLRLRAPLRLPGSGGRARSLRRAGVEDLELGLRSASELPAFEAAARRWRDVGGRFGARLLLDRENFRVLPKLVSALATTGAERALLVFHRSLEGWDRVPVRSLPGMREAASRAADALARLEELGIMPALCGIPACAAGTGPRRTLEPYRPFDECMGAAAAPAPLSTGRGRAKQKVRACAGCAESEHCEGIWNTYLASRGDGEFHAL